MPTVIYTPPMNPPAAGTYGGEDGDVWVRTGGVPVGQQQRFNSAANGGPSWTIFLPREYRADTIPLGGAANEVVLKAGGNPYASTWANPASSVVRTFDEHSPNAIGIGSDEWELTHQLNYRFVDVTVIADDDETIIVPRVEYVSLNVCRLYFAEPRDGTAIVRR